MKIENNLRKDSKGKKEKTINYTKTECILLSAIGILIKFKNIFQL